MHKTSNIMHKNNLLYIPPSQKWRKRKKRLMKKAKPHSYRKTAVKLFFLCYTFSVPGQGIPFPGDHGKGKRPDGCMAHGTEGSSVQPGYRQASRPSPQPETRISPYDRSAPGRRVRVSGCFLPRGGGAWLAMCRGKRLDRSDPSCVCTAARLV